MAVRGLEVLKLSLALLAYGICSVSGVRDCTLPWNKPKSVKEVYDLGWVGAAEYGLNNVCPSVLGDQNKEYCCYTISGDVSCCDEQGAMFFGVVLLIVMIVILLMSCCFICRVCCSRGPRGQNGFVLMPAPMNNAAFNQTRGSIP